MYLLVLHRREYTSHIFVKQSIEPIRLKDFPNTATFLTDEERRQSKYIRQNQFFFLDLIHLSLAFQPSTGWSKTVVTPCQTLSLFKRP